MPSEKGKETGPTIREAVERHIPDALRRLGDPFVVLFEGEYYSVTYMPNRPSATQWLIRQVSIISLPPTPLSARLVCIECGVGMASVGRPLGWKRLEGEDKCPRCSGIRR